MNPYYKAISTIQVKDEFFHHGYTPAVLLKKIIVGKRNMESRGTKSNAVELEKSSMNFNGETVKTKVKIKEKEER